MRPNLEDRLAMEPGNLELQLQYAQELASSGDLLFSDYIKLLIKVQESAHDSEQFWNLMSLRDRYLERRESLWLWDQSVGVSRIPDLIATFDATFPGWSLEHRNPASVANVEDLEGELGFSLPMPYRELLINFSDGFEIHSQRYEATDRFFGTRLLRNSLSNKFLKAARSECRLGWAELQASESGFEVKVSNDHGMLLIGEDDCGSEYYLIVNGLLKGMLLGLGDCWGCLNFQPLPIDPPRSKWPVDTILTIQDIVTKNN